MSIDRLLCLIGRHKWAPDYTDAVGFQRECLICGKEEAGEQVGRRVFFGAELRRLKRKIKGYCNGL